MTNTLQSPDHLWMLCSLLLLLLLLLLGDSISSYFPLIDECAVVLLA